MTDSSDNRQGRDHAASNDRVDPISDGRGGDPGDCKLAFHDPSGDHRFEWHHDQPAGASPAHTAAASATATGGVHATLDVPRDSVAES